MAIELMKRTPPAVPAGFFEGDGAKPESGSEGSRSGPQPQLGWARNTPRAGERVDEIRQG